MSTKTTITQALAQASATGIANLPQVADRFKSLYKQIHGEDSGAFYEAEKFHFAKLISENQILQQCDKLSLYGVFLDVAVNGLSFDPSFKQVYLVPFNTNEGSKQSPIWVKKASLMISGIGELLLRVRQGQIKYADNPVLVYEGQHFQFGTKNGSSYLEHIGGIPNEGAKIIACYMAITRHDGTVDYKVITKEDMDRFRKFSKDPNSKAWVDGEGGMWIAKCIKHAFKNYPKVRVGGQFTRMESETVETEIIQDAPVIPDNIDYGTGEIMDDEIPEVESNTPQAEEVPEEVNDDF